MSGSSFSHLHDEHGGRTVRVRGAVKVALHLAFGVLVIAVEQAFRLLEWRPVRKRACHPIARGRIGYHLGAFHCGEWLELGQKALNFLATLVDRADTRNPMPDYEVDRERHAKIAEAASAVANACIDAATCVPFDSYELSDIADPRLPDYRVYVFPNAFTLSEGHLGTDSAAVLASGQTKFGHTLRRGVLAPGGVLCYHSGRKRQWSRTCTET